MAKIFVVYLRRLFVFLNEIILFSADRPAQFLILYILFVFILDWNQCQVVLFAKNHFSTVSTHHNMESKRTFVRSG